MAADQGNSQHPSATQALLQHFSVPHSELTFGDKKAQGAFGEVFQGQWRGEQVAIKRLLITQLSETTRDSLQQEALVMANLRSQFVLPLQAVVLSPPYCLVTPWMPNGSLFDVLHSKQALSWPLRHRIILEMAQGLSYLHAANVIHRDLKSMNVLMDEHLHPKLADFGLSKVKTETRRTTKVGGGEKGTVAWMSPELFGLRPKYGQASDIYAFAMVVWEVAAREMPYEDVMQEGQIVQAIKDGDREELEDSWPEVFKAVIQRCWTQSMDQRPSAADTVTYLQGNPITDPVASWEFHSERPKPAEMSEAYVLLEPSSEDIAKVTQAYQGKASPGIEIQRIQVVYNPEMNRGFGAQLSSLQQRHNNAAFAPKWSQESNADQRLRVMSEFQGFCDAHRDPRYPNVSLVPAWHGSRPDRVQSILKTGYANLATTDSGFFGKGIYSALEPQYSYEVYSKQGCLVMNWVSLYSGYPVVHPDRRHLEGKGNYQNYDAHVIPVKPASSHPDEVSFYECQPQDQAKYWEVAVFAPTQCLPRYLVTVGRPGVARPLPEQSSNPSAGVAQGSAAAAAVVATSAQPGVYGGYGGSSAAAASVSVSVSASPAAIMGQAGGPAMLSPKPNPKPIPTPRPKPLSSS